MKHIVKMCILLISLSTVLVSNQISKTTINTKLQNNITIFIISVFLMSGCATTKEKALKIDSQVLQEQKLIMDEEEVYKLFEELVDKVEKHYYHNDLFDVNKIFAEFEKDGKDNKILPTKQYFYEVFNKQFDSMSGFYTQTQLEKKFAEYINKPSDVEIKNIDDVLYLKIVNLKQENLKDISDALKKQTKKIIIDIRDNSDSKLSTVVEFVNMFIDKGILLSYRYLDEKGKIKSSVSQANKKTTIVKDAKIAILINEKTGSVFEAVANSLKYDKNISTIGQDTEGNAHSYKFGMLKNGDAYVFKNGEYYYGYFNIVDRIGLNPSRRIHENNPKLDKTLIEALQYVRGES